jgi:hypothetical protein
MRKIGLGFLLLLLAVPSYAQFPFSSKAIREFNNALTQGSIFGSPRYATTALPLCDGSAGGLLNIGAVAFDTTAGVLKFCTGSAWSLAAGVLSGTNVWTGANTFNDGASGFAVANVADSSKLLKFSLTGVTASNVITLAIAGTAANPQVGLTSDTIFGRGGTDGAVRIFGGTTPTISSGFGTGPSVVAGGSNSLFQVNVGTVSGGTTGVVAFHGTWTNAPLCFAQDTTTQAVTTTTVATTSQVTLNTGTAWTASSIINVFCVSP